MKKIGKITDIIATIVLVGFMIAYVIARVQLIHEQKQSEELAAMAAQYKIALESALKQSVVYQDSADLQGKVNDSLLLVIDAKDKALADMKIKHKQEIDAIKNIPPDTIYKLLETLFPNIDAMPQKYPFSTSQITPLYTTVILGQQLQVEYNALSTSYRGCRDLTTGLYKENALLDSANIKLNSAVYISENVINSLTLTTASLRADNKKFKTWTKITAIAGTIFAIIAVAK